MSSTKTIISYKQVMELTGFYRNGKATTELIEAKALSARTQIEKKIKYQAVIDQEKLGASAIFELSGSPCIYFKRLDQSEPTANELAEMHKIAWNQGLAPMLWVVTPSKVLLYNCYSKPSPDDAGNYTRHIIEIFEKTENELRRLNEFAGLRQIKSGEFWKHEKAKQIDRRQRVDATLLQDLLEAEKQLVEAKLERSIAHSLLSRAIFVAYLQDRGILKPQFFRHHFGVEKFTDLLSDKSLTYQLFEWVRKTFNGDLFPLVHKNGHIKSEQDIVKPQHLVIVQNLLSGTEMISGQGRFWPYSFDVIPIELISSIYEMFAHASDAESAKDRSTHYTPINLVDLVLSQVFEGLAANANVLDLSCGSGVFLVESLRRLIASRIANGEGWTRELVRETLYNQIYGVDISKEAVQIAAFSLYLTVLEMDPDPQPPSALKFRPLIGQNLFAADAFDEEATFNQQEPFASKKFEAIIGNPPWTTTKSNRLYIDYCNRKDYTISREALDQAFLWRIGDFANEKTCIGVILAAKPFFSHTDDARKAKKDLLSRFKPKAMINLADLRMEKLFPTAIAPAMVLIAEGEKPKAKDSFSFVFVERTSSFKRHGIIEIGSENVKRLSTCHAASDPDMLKVASWGGARDLALIRRLRNSFLSLEQIIDENKLHAGQGFQKSGKIEAPELYGKKWLPSGQLSQYQINLDALAPFPKQGLHRPRNPKIYQGPLVITPRGLGKNRFIAAFSQKDVVYTELYFGISVAKHQEHLAHLLNAILNSSLATYFLFLTASVWGIERDEIKPEDLLRLPIPPSSKDRESLIDKIIKIEGQLRQLRQDTTASQLRRQLDEAVFDFYELDDTERVLVEDTVSLTIDLRMKRESSDAIQHQSITDVESYAKQLIGVIQPFFQTLNERTMVADIYDTGNAALQVVKFSFVSKSVRRPIIKQIAEQSLEPLLARIAEHLPQKIAENIYTRRILRIYEGDDIYVVKPAQRRHWSRSAGLNDADAILGEALRK
jgi:N-6 DNA Methylase